MTTTTISNNHSDMDVAVETMEEPAQLIHVRDMIWYSLPLTEKQSFAQDFDVALTACKDPTYVWQRYLIWLLREELAHGRCFISDRVATLYEQWVGGDRPTEETFRAVAMDADDEAKAVHNRLPFHRHYVLSAAMFAAQASYDAYMAAKASLLGAISRQFFVRNNRQRRLEEERNSFRRQRDTLLQLLSNS